MNNNTIKIKFIISFLTEFFGLVYPVIFFTFILIMFPVFTHNFNILVLFLLISLVIFNFILNICNAKLWIHNYKKKYILNSFINCRIVSNILSIIFIIFCLFIENKTAFKINLILSVVMFSAINIFFFVFFEDCKIGTNDLGRQFFEISFIRIYDICEILQDTFDEFWILDKRNSNDGYFYIYSKQQSFQFNNDSLVFKINDNWIYYSDILETQKELEKKLVKFNQEELDLLNMYYN